MIHFYHGLIGSPRHFESAIQAARLPTSMVRNPDVPYLTEDIPHILRTLPRSQGATVHVGNSIGCRFATEMAGPTDHLVLTAPPFDYGQGTVPLRRALVAEWIADLYVNKGNIPDEAAIFEAATQQILGLMESRDQIRKLRSYKDFALAFWEDQTLHDAQERVTFVIGEADFTTPVVAFTRYVKTHLPKATVRVLKHCGHAVPLDAPDRVAQIIRTSLAETTRQRRCLA